MVERIYYEVTGDTDETDIASEPYSTVEEALALYNKLVKDISIYNLVIRRVIVSSKEEIVYPPVLNNGL